MAKTRAQLTTSVQGTTGRSDKDSLIEDALDFGLAALGRRHPWRQSRSTISLSPSVGDSSAALTSGTTHVYWALCEESTSSGWRITVVNERLYHKLVPNLSSLANGKPVVAWVDGETFRWARAAESTYTIKVRGSITQTLSSSSSTSPYSETDEFLIAYATAYLFRSIENFQSAETWTSRSELLLAEAIKFDMRYSEDRPSVPFGYDFSNTNFDVEDPFLTEVPS